MADKNEYYEFLYAYALGCLDENDLVNLKNYLDVNKDFYWQELGEYQNLSSLLPSILAIEIPQPEVKDKVARKLYRIRNEIKAKRDQARKEKLVSSVSQPQADSEILSGKNSEIKPEEKKEPGIKIEQTNSNLPEEKTEESVQEKFKPDVEGFEVVRSAKKTTVRITPEEQKPEEKSAAADQKEKEQEEETTFDFKEAFPTPNENEIDTTSEELPGSDRKITEVREAEKAAEENRLTETPGQEKVKKKSGLYTVIAFIAFFVVIAGVVFLYLKVSSDVKNYETKINRLNQQISNLSDQFAQNRDLQIVLNSKNLKTVSLAGTNLAKETFGKIFLDPETNRGFIQLTNIPALPENEIYQLWINISGNFISLGKIKTADNFSYSPFKAPPLNDNSMVSFQLTEEPAGGSSHPGSKVFLTGTLR